MAVGARALRALLLDALRGVEDDLTDRLGALASWQGLAALWESGWLGRGRGSARLTAAEIRAALREIAAARREVPAVHAVALGEMVCVVGTVAPSPSGDDAIRVVDATGAGVEVALDGRVRFVGGPLAIADRVTVLGFADVVVDPALARASPRGLPRRAILRASSSTPLLVLRER